jgi:hypothetical protein
MRKFGAFLIVTAMMLSSLPADADRSTVAEDFLLEGTMHYLDVQGGCWVLQDDQGTRYQLIGNTQSLEKEGLRLVVKVRPGTGLVSKCMVGKLVRLVKVVERK